jgi:hypothetical protein
MPTNTLQIRYSSSVRPNRRRVRHPILRAAATLLVWVVALLVLIGLLMKVGFLQEPVRPVYVATVDRGGLWL